MKIIIPFLLFLFIIGCTKKSEPLSAPIVSKPVFERFTWTEAIDSLKGQYFQGIDNSNSNELFVNVWKGWNGGGPTQEPTTLLSFDNGNSWKTVSEGSGLPRTWTYVQKQGSTLFAGTPDKGLFISNDNGLTWKPSTTINWIWPEIIKSTDNKIVISDFRLEKTYLSSDNGFTWQLIYPAFLRVINISESTILALNRGVVLRSTNWGNTWSTDNSLTIQLGGNQSSLGISKRMDTLIVAIQKGIYIKSRLSGETWEKISTPIKKDLGLYAEIDGKIIVQEQFTNILYYTDDYGKNWKNFGGMNGRIWNIVKSGKFLFASGEYGLFKRQIAE
ncbi:MAG: WD40/YVTN/BNR-like repeat-containing protein [Chitinophagaceae bacterium]